MATYFTDDFADHATDWTRRYNTSTTDYAVSSGDLQYSAGKTNDWCADTWNDVEDGNHANIELLGKLYFDSLAAARFPLILRGSGADETPSLYSVSVTGSVVRVNYSSGSDNSTIIASASFTLTPPTTVWIRFRVNGTTLQARIWTDGESEPAAWSVDTTDSTVAGTGWSGAASYTTLTAASIILRQLGVGTNGDTAPSAAATAASIAFAPRFPRAILNF